MRERGLKRPTCLSALRELASLPVRERGLKQRVFPANSKCGMSLPVRERGLKHTGGDRLRSPRGGAPRAGAWIEALPCSSTAGLSRVAPRAGAWIEAP